jgi:hypothetical protein
MTNNKEEKQKVGNLEISLGSKIKNSSFHLNIQSIVFLFHQTQFKLLLVSKKKEKKTFF